jgi:DNA adenine methylase
MNKVNENIIATPFLRWAGGKRWLISKHSSLFPSNVQVYFEPFLGSASVYFHLNPERAILSDLNPELINCYESIRDNWEEVYDLLTLHQSMHCSEYYYKIRASEPLDSIQQAARFIYLNRTCWNGLYRVNGSGKFNVPIGTKKNVLLDTDDFKGLSKMFSKAKFLQKDFEFVINKAKEGDFIFADPPYTVKHNFNGFVSYNEKIFHWDDQIRLSEALIRASNRGCLVMLTNANHHTVKDLYKDHFEIKDLSRYSRIAGIASNRGMYKEVIIRNY